LALIPVGIIARTTRAAVAEVLNLDFVTTLRAKGLSEIAVIRHVLKNSAPQVLAVMGLQFGYLMGGSILIETVFTCRAAASCCPRQSSTATSRCCRELFCSCR